MAQRFEKSTGNKQKIFDRCAPEWDAEEVGKKEAIRALVKALGLKAGDTVIEPGCGTGVISKFILEEIGENGRLYGLDISKRMLEQAEAKGLPSRALFYHADAANMPLPAGCADAVVCVRVFPHIDDQHSALSEFNRVLKNGGRLIIAHLAGREKLNRYHAEVGGEVAEDMIPDEDEMRTLLESYGFELISLEDREERYLLCARKKEQP
jgi:ubiquinone/menaquinone biosynthesis C-methylase UbiE